MNLPQFALRRPFTVIVIVIAVALVSVLSWQQMPKDIFPTLGIPTITFDLDNYWDRNYRGRDFYRDRDRWAQQGPDWGQNDGDPNWNRRPPPPPRSYDRQYDDN